MGHDVLNDFHAIRLALEILQTTKGDDEALQIALNNVDTSVRLIKKMRKLETLVSKGGELRAIQIRPVLNEVIKTYAMSKVNFIIEGSCTILADAAFSSVLDNIIQNAIIHGKTDRIDIEIEPKRKYCDLKIVDYGVGIPDEAKAKLFQKGFKYGKTGQTGLGLFIVRNLLERYGGKISVKENTPTGTIFILKLRRAIDQKE